MLKQAGILVLRDILSGGGGICVMPPNEIQAKRQNTCSRPRIHWTFPRRWSNDSLKNPCDASHDWSLNNFSPKTSSDISSKSFDRSCRRRARTKRGTYRLPPLPPLHSPLPRPPFVAELPRRKYCDGLADRTDPSWHCFSRICSSSEGLLSREWRIPTLQKAPLLSLNTGCKKTAQMIAFWLLPLPVSAVVLKVPIKQLTLNVLFLFIDFYFVYIWAFLRHELSHTKVSIFLKKINFELETCFYLESTLQ